MHGEQLTRSVASGTCTLLQAARATRHGAYPMRRSKAHPACPTRPRIVALGASDGGEGREGECGRTAGRRRGRRSAGRDALPCSSCAAVGWCERRQEVGSKEIDEQKGFPAHTIPAQRNHTRSQNSQAFLPPTATPKLPADRAQSTTPPSTRLPRRPLTPRASPEGPRSQSPTGSPRRVEGGGHTSLRR